MENGGIKMKIGFIGIGVMGQAMATHLLKAGNQLYVHNRTKSKADQLVQLGAVWCEDIKTIAQSADLIFTIIGVPADVKNVYLSEEGLINHAKTNTILVDMTTSTPQIAKEIYAAGQIKGIQCLDAPVTGGDIGAKNGTLTIMVGGEEGTYKQILPILQLMGTTITYMGAAGNGQHTKMTNQIAIAGAVMGMVEALSYAQGASLDLNNVIKTVSSGSGGSWQLSNMAPRIVKGDFEPGFYIKHFIKDMKIASDESTNMDLDLPGLELVLSLYQECADKNSGNLGTQALYKLYEK